MPKTVEAGACQLGQRACHLDAGRAAAHDLDGEGAVGDEAGIAVGRNSAVAELPLGIRFRGFPAWVAWLFLHLLYLVGFRNRANVVVDWGWNYLTYDRGARVIVDSNPMK